MVKEKKINGNILKKLKPIEIEKKRKKEEQKKFDEETAPEISSQEQGFSDNSIWKTKEFDAPTIIRSEAEPAPLEKTAEEAETPGGVNQDTARETEINYSSLQRSESSAYRISSDYEGRTTYDSRKDGESMRPTMGLGNEQRRTGLTNPFVRPEEVKRSELEEFSRLEEQEEKERERMKKLPFMQKDKREEIF